jgi:hypothetical protein
MKKIILSIGTVALIALAAVNVSIALQSEKGAKLNPAGLFLLADNENGGGTGENGGGSGTGETIDGGELPEVIIECSGTDFGKCYKEDCKPDYSPIGSTKKTICCEFSGRQDDFCVPNVTEWMRGHQAVSPDRFK